MLFTLILHISTTSRYKNTSLGNPFRGNSREFITCKSQQGMSKSFHSDTPSHAQTRRLLDEPEVIAVKKRGSELPTKKVPAKITICLVLYNDLQYDGRIQERHDSKTTQSFRDKPRILKDSHLR
jgi:hypothetical protein